MLSVQNVELTLILSKCQRSNFIDFLSFYFVMKRLMITKNSVVKIQNFILNQKSRPIKLNHVAICSFDAMQ